MQVGLLSDSHGNNDRLGQAAKLLLDHGAEVLVHCGDIVDENALHQLGKLHVPAYAVAGNMDRDLLKQLNLAAELARVVFAPDAVTLPLGDGRKLAATHGHHEQLLKDLAADPDVTYLCHGHTHRRRDERFGNTRVINPGSLYKPKDRPSPGCMLLDTDTDTLQAFDLPD